MTGPLVRKPAAEQHRAALEQAEPGLDERPVTPRLAPGDTVEIEVVEDPVVPETAIDEDRRSVLTALEDGFEKQECVEFCSAGRDFDVDGFEGFDVDGCQK